MTTTARRVAAVLASLIAPVSFLTAQPSVTAARPSLIVLITIDQMRGDYLTRFGPQLTGGLARLSRGGAWYTNAHHDHAITETAPGHATLLAGRFPRSTGITANRVGVEDPQSPLIAGGVGTGASPRRFIGTTLTDWLIAADPQSRTLSVSTKDRAAILPAGRTRADVYWYSLDGRFTTSTYYRDSLPSWVTVWNNRHFPQTFNGKSWTLLLPEGAYPEKDSVPAEAAGVGFVFPHIMPEDETAPSVLRGTPFIDDVTLSFAIHGVQSLALGARSHTDLLAVSLSGTDFIGHRYGPDSREIHDQILRLDRTLGVFLDSLYRLRDSSRVTIVLTGDHGGGTMPELAPASMQPRPVHVTIGPQVRALRAALTAAHVDSLAIDFDVQAISVNRAAFAAAHVNADSTMSALAESLRRVPGVARVDHFHALLADTLTDPIARRWSHQFPASSDIDLVITLTPLSLWGNAISSHGSPYDYDSNVPLVFYGAGVRPGMHADFVRTVDLAPTLAALAGVRLTQVVDGVILTGALK